jgi:hypothetical protein
MDNSTVLDRTRQVIKANDDTFADRWRIRSIMNGGAEGMWSVLAYDQGRNATTPQQLTDTLGIDLPTVNLVYSGLERTAQQVGREPTLKAPVIDDEPAQRRADDRMAIVRSWDEANAMEMQYPQIGRWLPGYAYVFWNLRIGTHYDIGEYPEARLRNSYDVLPGWFGPEQEPTEVVVRRQIPFNRLKDQFPHINWATIETELKQKGTVPAQIGQQVGSTSRNWEGEQSGVTVCEYHCSDGMYLNMPDIMEQDVILAYVPNLLTSGPSFVFAKRFSFDRLINQYVHIYGLMGQMAKFNILGMISAEDSTFRPTNIIGELESGKYEMGRGAINMFREGTRIERPTAEMPQHMMQQVAQLERQIRIGANYSVQEDGQAASGWTTGKGAAQLRGAANNNIREYHGVMSHALRQLDVRRLEMAEMYWAGQKKKYYTVGGLPRTYDPGTRINGDYRTRRVYGAMATWDDQEKVIIGMQLKTAQVMDTETLQENIDGLKNLGQVNMRIKKERAFDTLWSRLEQRTQEDPKADAALAEIIEKPQNATEILIKYFAPKEPDLSPEEQMAMAQMMGQGAGAGGGEMQGQPPPVGTVMSRIMGGQAEGGVQQVARI